MRIRRLLSSSKTASPFHVLILAFLVAILAYLSAKLAGTLVLRPQMIWPLWPGCALLVAVLLLVPRKIWPIIIPAGLAAFLVYDLQNGVTLRETALLILSDAIEILIAALGVSYSFGGVPLLNNVKSLGKYSFFAVLLGPAAAAFVGTAALGGTYWVTWRISYFTEALALLTVTPAILCVITNAGTWTRKSGAYYTEAVALSAGLVLWGNYVFSAAGPHTSAALLYSLLPFLLWSALRFGLIGISTSMVVVAFLSIWGVVHGRGPFSGSEPLTNVLSLQLFLFCAATPFMFLAVLVEEQKKAEQAVRESEERFRLVANAAPVLIWMSDPQKLCNYFNLQWLEFTGRTLDAELGNGWSEGVHCEDLHARLETYAIAFAARQPFKMQYRLRRHDGEYRWLLDIGAPRFNRDGSFAGYIGSCIDITDRKLAEEALSGMGRRLIEATEKERSRVARELHDDICQRLAILTLEIEQSMKSSGSTLLQTQRIEEAWKHCSEITGDVQALSHELHSSMLDHLGLIAATQNFCGEFSEQHDVAVEFAHSDVPTSLPGDVSLGLFRVIQEALHNALKHSGVSAYKVELRGTPDRLNLEIRDRGKGLDLEHARNNGGLGLISMEERVHLVRGTFAIESELNGGTTIHASVPLTPKPAAVGPNSVEIDKQGLEHATRSNSAG